MELRFGTDGVRGVAGQAPIDAAGALAIGAAAARWSLAVADGRVTVGRDPRPSGPSLTDAVVQGVVRAGGVARDAGVVPTPALQAWVAEAGGVGVMVTASHNPAADNGFKVVGPGGRKPDDAATALLEAFAAGPVTGCGGGADDVHAAVIAAWTRRLGRHDLRGLGGRRILLDLAHGAAVAVLPALRAALPDVRWGTRGDGGGVINDGVGSEHPGALAAAVRDGGFDAGLAVDGDGDRCVLVDERGQVVPGDGLLWRLAASWGVSRLVVTVMSTYALEALLPGVQVVRTPVGDRHVAAALGDGPLGGEESGHVLVAGAPGGDGLVTGLLALAACWAAAATVSEALAGFAPWPRATAKVRSALRVPVEDPRLDAPIRRAAAAVAPGRVLVRWSGTEPVLRVLVEGPDAGVVQATADALVAALRGALTTPDGASG